MPKPNQTSSPFAEVAPSGPRFSLATLLMIMVVFSGMSAALCFAMAVPRISAEVNAWFGRSEPTNRDGTDRALQFTFLLFCYSAPLLMAGFVSTLSYVLQKMATWSDSRHESDDDGLPWDTK